MQQLATCLWYDDDAEEAARLYERVIPDSAIGGVTRYDDGGAEVSGRPEGSVMTVDMRIAGQPFVLLNGGPRFTFNEATSFMLHCDDQAEVDRLWEELGADGGEHSRCGWLKDRFGVSWQVVPARLLELQRDADPEVARRVNAAMLAMDKLDVAELERAARAPSAV